MTNLPSLLSPLITLCRLSARRALQWRLLVLYLLALLPPLALLVLPAWSVLDEQLSHSVHAAALAQQLDLSAITDLLAAGQRQALAAKVALAAALLCTAALSPLLAGATLTAARSALSLPCSPLSGATRPAGAPPSAPLPVGAMPGGPRSGSQLSGRSPPAAPLSFGALLAGAIADYPRMLRMLLWSAVVMGAVLAAGGLLVEWAQPQEALLPDQGKIAEHVARILSALLAWSAMASIDAGRAVLAADRRRRSVIHGWRMGVVLLCRHPGLALGSYAALGAIGFAVAGLFGLARLHAPAGALAGDLAGVLLTQIVVLLLAWFRCARLFALLAVARQ